MPRKPAPKLPAAPRLRAYGYTRVSTEEQAQEGISLAAQADKIRAYAALQDLELVEVVADEGESGKDLERAGLKRLLTAIAGGEAEAVVVTKLDRLSRRTRDLLLLVEDVFGRGRTRFVSVGEQIDTETALGKFFLTLMGALAQMERELISERTRAALAYKKARGERIGSPPMGFRPGPGELVADPHELAVVRRIHLMRRQGESYGRIARLLNAEAVPTKRGGRWHASTVRYLVVNPRYRAALKASRKKAR